MMKTIQMTIEQNLLTEIDEFVEKIHVTRSAFVRDALKMALHRFKINEMEKQHRAAYSAQPQTVDEVDIWQAEQVWGDEWRDQPIQQGETDETW